MEKALINDEAFHLCACTWSLPLNIAFFALLNILAHFMLKLRVSDEPSWYLERLSTSKGRRNRNAINFFCHTLAVSGELAICFLRYFFFSHHCPICISSSHICVHKKQIVKINPCNSIFILYKLSRAFFLDEHRIHLQLVF